MGCDTSKASTRQDADVTNNNSDVFTENQIDTLRSTWPLLARNLKTNGIRVFRLVFLTEPSTRYVFKSVRHKTQEETFRDPFFQKHVQVYMSMIGFVVDNIDTNKEEVEKTLLILGAKHASFEGFNKDHFRVFTRCTLEVWESVIAEEFITEVRDTWENLLSYVVRYMDKGFSLYNQEHAEQSTTLIEEEEDVVDGDV